MALGAILSGAASLASAFGKKKARPGQSVSGFAALPPDIQDAYRNYLSQVNQFGNSGLNQYEQAAINELGQAGYGNYQQYMNPYLEQVQGQVLQDIEQQGAQNRNRLLDILGGRNSLTAFSSSAAGQELGRTNAETQNARARAIAELQNQGFQQALLGRQQGIQNQLLAGQYPAQRISQYGSLLGQLPGSNINTAGTPERTNSLGRLGGIGNALLGNQYFTNFLGGF